MLIKLLMLLFLSGTLLLSASEAAKVAGKAKRWWGVPDCASMPAGIPWANTWHEYFVFTCPDGQSLSLWHSIHRNCKEDRIHYFQCQTGPGSFQGGNCAWVGHYVNDYDQAINFKCSHNGFLAGVRSEYGWFHKDRKFGFRCCHIPGSKQHTCKTTPLQNDWDKPLSFKVPSGYYMVGARSEHRNFIEDRRWQFEICQISKKK